MKQNKMELPSSIDKCLYFTRRELDNNGSIIAWVLKKKCQKCGKAVMGKPVEAGKVKIRAKEYVCPNCSHTETKEEHEASCTLNVKYKCPYCGNEGETTTEYKRKNFNVIPSYVFECQKCNKKIGITKKMKEGKKFSEGD